MSTESTSSKDNIGSKGDAFFEHQSGEAPSALWGDFEAALQRDEGHSSGQSFTEPSPFELNSQVASSNAPSSEARSASSSRAAEVASQINQIVSSMLMRHGPNFREVKIQLANVGFLDGTQVHLSMGQEGLSVAFEAKNADSQDFLQRHTAELELLLKEKLTDGKKVSVSSQLSGQSDPNSDQGARNAYVAYDEDEKEIEAPIESANAGVSVNVET